MAQVCALHLTCMQAVRGITRTARSEHSAEVVRAQRVQAGSSSAHLFSSDEHFVCTLCLPCCLERDEIAPERKPLTPISRTVAAWRLRSLLGHTLSHGDTQNRCWHITEALKSPLQHACDPQRCAKSLLTQAAEPGAEALKIAAWADCIGGNTPHSDPAHGRLHHRLLPLKIRQSGSACIAIGSAAC